MTDEELEGLRLEYLASLQDLKINSKPIINNLTMIAQDNINAHFVVIKAIETRLQTAPSNELLPVVYLIDSICKNVRGVYVDAFSLVIRRLFQSVYEKAPVIRDSLKRLAGTWQGIFPSDVVREIEDYIRSQELQQQRPPPELQANVRHSSRFDQAPAARPVEPPFRTQPSYPPLPQQYPAQPRRDVGYDYPPQVQRVQFDRWDDRGGRYDYDNYRPTPPPPQQPTPIDPWPRHDFGGYTDRHMFSGPAAPTAVLPPAQSVCFSDPVLLPPVLLPPVVKSHFDDLYDSPINSRGSTPQPPGIGPPPGTLTVSPYGSLPLNTLELTNEALKKRYAGCVESLYDVLPKVCSNCGFRFPDTVKGDADLREHLDWHFRQRQREKEKLKKTTFRDWYLPASVWLLPSKSQNISAISSSIAPRDLGSKVIAQEDKQMCPVKDELGNESSGVCGVCGEPIERVYDNQSEAWVFEDAVRFRGQVYHVACQNDADNVSNGTPAKRSFASVTGADLPSTSSIEPDSKKIKKEESV